MLELEIINHKPANIQIPKSVKTQIQKSFEQFLRVMQKIILQFTKENNSLVNLIFTDNQHIQEINKQFRGKDKPTDVISFAYLEEEKFRNLELLEEKRVVGEIFISLEIAQKQAEEKGHTIENEMEILFVHGMLHLFGFDHQNDEQEEEMESWAKKILNCTFN